MCPGRAKGRGRRRGQRWITEIPEKRRFSPEGTSATEAINLSFEELEAIRLVDLLGLQQQEAAFYMGISRKALWNDLRSARKKVASALVYGLGIRISGGNYALRGEQSNQRPEQIPEMQGQDQDRQNDAMAPGCGKEEKMALLEKEAERMEELLVTVKTRMKALKLEDDYSREPIK